MTAPFLPLVEALVEMVRPLRNSLHSAQDFGALLARYGWMVEIDEGTLGPLNAAFALEPLLQTLENDLDDLAGADPAARDAALSTLLESAIAVVQRLSNLSVGTAGLSAPFDRTEFWSEFGPLVATDLLVTYLERRQPGIFSLLHLCGALRIDSVVPAGAGRAPFERATLDWQQLGAMLGQPDKAIQAYYRWGDPAGFDHPRLLRTLERVALAQGLAAVRTPPLQRPALAGLTAEAVAQAQLEELWIPLLEGVSTTEQALWRIGLAVTPLPDPVAAAGPARGLAVTPVLDGGAVLTKILSDSVRLTFSGAFDARKAIGFRLYPTRFEPVTAEPGIAAAIELDGTPPQPWVLLGSPEGSRFEADGMRLVAGLAGQLSDPEVFLGGGTGEAPRALRLVIALGSDGDAFASQIVGDGFKVEFPINLLWSSKRGLQFEGGLGVDFSKALHVSLGPFTLNRVHIAAHGSASGAELTAGVGITGKLGPLLVNLDDIGLKAGMRPAAAGDAGFGNIGLAFGFKPPSGLGLLIDAGAVSGGGYLACTDGFYAGALQLSIKNTLQLKAVGFISTKRPDGTPGFSMVIAVSAEFSPIQLGYGFTLDGVGGLAAFNRRMDTDALRDGIRNRTLDSIMFPPDPVANAPRIISDLQRVFPEAPGRFVFAPMVKIGWGESILVIEVGLAVELPAPLVLAIMGKIHLYLPPDTAGAGQADKVIEMHLDVLGVFDFDRSEISVDAVLYDSRVALFPVTGGMALRIKWGKDPVFLLSVGGFNPRFAPPPSFPPLDRVGIQLDYDKNGITARLCLTSYIAVTTNTVQFGARVDAYAKVSIASLAGYLGFDALVELAPFHLIADLYGGVSIKAFNIGFSCDILLTLNAFDPVTGDGHVTIDFFGKHEVAIHFAIGAAKPLPALPVVDPLDRLIEALADTRNWSAVLPVGQSLCVTLRQPTPAEVTALAGRNLVHPLGRLSLRQKTLPLGIVLQRFGAARPARPGPYDIAGIDVGAAQNVPTSGAQALRDSFARGPFLDLSEEEKVTGPQFEDFVCGYAGLGTEVVRTGAAQAVMFDYEVRVIDSAPRVPRVLPRLQISYAALQRSASFGAVASAATAVGAVGRYAAPALGIVVHAPSYKDMATDRVDPADAEFPTWTQARAHAGAAKRRQVVDSAEFA